MNDDINRALRPLQIVIIALIGGLIAFGAIAVVLVTGKTVAVSAQNATALLIALSALAAGELVAYVVLRSSLIGALRRQWQVEPAEHDPTLDFAPKFFTITLVPAAMVEGLALFGLITYLMTGDGVGLAAAIAGVLLLAMLFPTTDRLRRFVAAVTDRHWP